VLEGMRQCLQTKDRWNGFINSLNPLLGMNNVEYSFDDQFNKQNIDLLFSMLDSCQPINPGKSLSYDHKS